MLVFSTTAHLSMICLAYEKKNLVKTHTHYASKLEFKFKYTFTPILYLVEVASFWLICLFMEGKNMCKWLVRHLVTLTCRTYILTSTRLKWLLEYHSSPSRKKLQTWLCTFLWNWVGMYSIYSREDIVNLPLCQIIW